MRGIIHMEFIQHFNPYGINCLFAVTQLFRDFLAVKSLRDELQYFQLFFGDMDIFHIPILQVTNI